MILIGLGANLPSAAGAPEKTLRAALAALAENGVEIAAVSYFYRSQAWPDASDPPFVNAVARVMTTDDPRSLLNFLHAVENNFGRTRGEKNAPRTLDIDVLDFNGRVESGPPQLPHRRLAERAFVLLPLRDVAPDWRHPVSGKSVDALIAELGAAAKSVNKID